MKAAVWYGQRDIRVENIPDPPEPGEGEIQAKVSYAGICGTDLKEYISGPVFIPWDTPHPLTGHCGPTILGHEMMGTVIAVGPNVTDFKVGDRVTPDIVLYCGKCDLCKQGKYVLCRQGASLGLQTSTGGFGEYVNMPAYTAHKLPPEVSNEAGAMAEPLATALHAIRRGGVSIGDNVAVIGGTTAFFAMQAAWLAGARAVFLVTIGKTRLKVATELGVTKAIDGLDDPIGRILDETGGKGVDVVIECAGTEKSLDTALQAANKCGRIVLLGIFGGKIPVDANQLVFFEKQMVGSLGRDSERDMETAIEYLKAGKIITGPILSAKIRLDDIVSEGFETLIKKPEKHLKILVSPT